ncbi:MAG: recombination mediator RecR [Holophagaceae bacterium]|jgi:recombination protein RecR
MKLPHALESVVEALQSLPGVGRKSAQRMVISLLKDGATSMSRLGSVLSEASQKLCFCSLCGGFSDQKICSICSDNKRDASLLLIVAEASNILAIEKSDKYKGHYHALGGLISPLKGIGPQHLRIKELEARLVDHTYQEIIVATNPTVDGEATASWLLKTLKPMRLQVSRIALGLPFGSDIEYADELTLSQSIQGRTKFN